jgi:hypothetical protein
MLSKIMNMLIKKKIKRTCSICNKEFNSDKEEEDHNNTQEHKDNVEIEEMVWSEISGKANPV